LAVRIKDASGGLRNACVASSKAFRKHGNPETPTATTALVIQPRRDRGLRRPHSPYARNLLSNFAIICMVGLDIRW